MVSAQEVRNRLGQRVRLALAAGAPGAPAVTGKIAAVTEALDGLVVTLEPDGAKPAARLTIHYHYIQEIVPIGDS